jgi:hypothetical protein
MKKMKGRWYRRVPNEDVKKNDLIIYIDSFTGGAYHRYVKSVAKKTVTVHMLITPSGKKHKRVARTNIKEVWRRSPKP